MASVDDEKKSDEISSVVKLNYKEKDKVVEISKAIPKNNRTENEVVEVNEKSKCESQSELENTEIFYDAEELIRSTTSLSGNQTETFYDAAESRSSQRGNQTNSNDNLREVLEGTDKLEDKVDEDEDEEKIEYTCSHEDLTPEQREERKLEAKQYKDQGNEYFRKSEYPEAKELYTRAMQICPNEFKEEKAVFYANRAACRVKMDQHKDAIEDCTKALDLNDEYLKARLRRAQCYEHVDKLEEALEDYQKVFDRDRSCHVAREALMRLPEQIKIKHEKMKEEMIGKLKDLGNVFLKPFGLSTNNFKLQQDPTSGGYTINFQK